MPDGSELAVAVGSADVERGRAMQPGDRMLAGSVGKTFVTAAAHHLVQRGELSLDARAATFFEEDEWYAELPNARDVTVRQLLRHTSGIPRYVFEEAFWDALLEDPDRVWEPQELLAFVAGDAPLFAAGEGWGYADTNYIVVGMICERASGDDFYDYVQRHFIEPHAFEGTLPSDTRRIPGLAQGYVTAARSFGIPERTLADGELVFNPQFEWCGGGFASTPTDLARWAKLLYGGQAFEGGYLDSLLEAVPAEALGPGLHYGLGVMTGDTELGPLHGHDGFMPGYLTSMGYFPELDLGAALQLNTDDGRRLGAPMRAILVRLAGIAARELER